MSLAAEWERARAAGPRALLTGPAVRFLAVGGAVTVLGYVLLRVLVRAFAPLPQPVALAQATTYALSIGVSYAANRRFTFRSGGSARAQFPRFVAGHLGSLALSSVLMQAGVSAGLPLLGAFVLVAPVTTTLNYVVQRRWVFAAGGPGGGREG